LLRKIQAKNRNKIPKLIFMNKVEISNCSPNEVTYLTECGGDKQISE